MILVFRQIYGKPNSAGCLENDFTFAGQTLQPNRSMIDVSIFDAQLMTSASICLQRKISRNSRVSMTRWTPCRLLGLELVSTHTKTTKRIFHATPRRLRLLQS